MNQAYKQPEVKMSAKEKGPIRTVLEIIEIIVIAFALSWLIRSYVIEARIVPTGSMLDTIQLGDRIIVDKFFFKYFDQIETGDIIVFKPPESAHATEDFIKRVIGLPGDRIEIKNDKTYINGQELNEPYVKEAARNDYRDVIVPEDSFFVMGDNRNNSADSRVWGFLPVENVTGRALFRYWPLKRIGSLYP